METMEQLYASRDDTSPASQLAARVVDRCTKLDQAYLAIVITILPQWAIITTLIVFMLIAFHNSLKAAIVYDNCSKLNAHHRYYVEIRTGDTSASFNRRRTTLYIDMFDDNQVTLARIGVPGNVIFGKKNAPIAAIDDEKYYELRVTRFWLYRALRLKKVSTIRLTHSCTDTDSRIMVYGLEIRSSEPETGKLFFPVMSNISAYGSVNRQNDSFDLESAGSISNLGGPRQEQASISNQLSWIDLTILTYFLSSLVFYLTSLDLFATSFDDFGVCVGKGALAGFIAYLITTLIGLLLRYYVKQRYSDRIGQGKWALFYYMSSALVLLLSSGLWIYTTIHTYRELCPKFYGMWVLAIVFAMGECAFFALLHSLLLWAVSLFTVRSADHYIIPDELSPTGSQQEPPSRAARPPTYGSRQNSGKQQLVLQQAPSNQVATGGAGGWHQMTPVPIMVPTGVGYQQHSGNLYAAPGAHTGPILMQPPTLVHSYKTVQATYPTTGYDAHPPNLHPVQPHVAGPTAPITYHQQTTNEQVNLQGIKATKKVGSQESTGSTYYQQLMKNKGGVKSISQYGELLRQKKLVTKAATKK